MLRTAFDELAGQANTVRFVTPKRPWRIHDTLSEGEVHRLLAAAPGIRDRLLIGLLYGCGLKTGEACALRWADVDTPHRPLSILRRPTSCFASPFAGPAAEHAGIRFPSRLPLQIASNREPVAL